MHKKALCLSAHGIGDAIMAAPAIDFLAKKRNYQVDVLVAKNSASIRVYEHMPCIHRIRKISLKSWNCKDVIKYLSLKIWQDLIRLPAYDLGVSFMPNPLRSTILLLMKTNQILSEELLHISGGFLRCFIINAKVKTVKYSNLPDKYCGYNSLELVGSTKKPNLWEGVFDFEEKRVFEANKRTVICLNITVGKKTRAWPYWNSLANLLMNQPDCYVVLIGKGTYDESIPCHFNYTNKTSVPELYSIINDCDLLVTTDSGPMHIAAVTKTHTIALFGGVAPKFRLPIDSNVQPIYLPCHDAEKPRRITYRMKRFGRLKEIPVSMVFSKVKQKLEELKVSNEITQRTSSL